MREVVSSTFVSLDGVVNHMETWPFDDLLIRQGLNKKLELTGTRTLSSGVVVLSLRNPDA